MLKKTQVLEPDEENLRFGMSHDFCDNGNTLAIRCMNTQSKKEMLYIYQLRENQYVLHDKFCPAWWHSNWQVSIRGINNSIYFAAVDPGARKGYVIRYHNNSFDTVFEVDNCEWTLGMNDKSIAVDSTEENIAITHFTVHHNEHDKTLEYSSFIYHYNIATGMLQKLGTPESQDPSRVWSFRSLAFANNCIVAGSPDLLFANNSDDTMERNYNGTAAKVDIFDLHGNHITCLQARDATVGNFYGTELETSVDGSTLVVMAPAQDNKVGCAYVYQYIDDTWVQTAKLSPREISIHTTIKYSLYGCCVSKDGSRVLLADGLYGALYLYNNGVLDHTHKEINNTTWFGFDIKTDQQFQRVAVIEQNVQFFMNSSGAMHVFEISDK